MVLRNSEQQHNFSLTYIHVALQFPRQIPQCLFEVTKILCYSRHLEV